MNKATIPHSVGERKLEATGTYHFEWLDPEGNVVDKASKKNIFTRHWLRWAEELNAFYQKFGVPAAPNFPVPCRMSMFNDTSPVDGSLGWRDWGTETGVIDLLWNNPDQSHPTQGNRALTFWKQERIDANTQKMTYVGEFGTAQANGDHTKIRMFMVSNDRAAAAADTDNSAARTTMAVLEAYQGLHPSPVAQAYLTPWGQFATHADWSPAESEPPSTPSGYGRKHLITSHLTSFASTRIAHTDYATMDVHQPNVFIAEMFRGATGASTPGFPEAGIHSSAAAKITLPQESSQDAYPDRSAGAINEDGDYLLMRVEQSSPTLTLYKRANGYTPEAPVTLQGAMVSTASSSNKYYAVSWDDIAQQWVLMYCPKRYHVAVVWVDVNLAIVNTKSWDLSHMTELETSSNDGFKTCWYDTETNGYIIEFKQAATTTYSTTAAGCAGAGYLWISEDPNASGARKYKAIGYVLAGRGSSDGDAPTAGSCCARPSGTAQYSERDVVSAKVYGAGKVSTSTVEARVPLNTLQYVHKEKAIMCVNWRAQSVVWRPFCICHEPLISETAINVSKTAANSLRVTYELTITES